jgi:hypothetical protein
VKNKYIFIKKVYTYVFIIKLLILNQAPIGKMIIMFLKKRMPKNRRYYNFFFKSQK